MNYRNNDMARILSATVVCLLGILISLVIAPDRALAAPQPDPCFHFRKKIWDVDFNEINENGDVSGTAIERTVTGIRQRAVFIPKTGPMQYLLRSKTDGGVATGLNNVGEVVGSTLSTLKGFAWRKGVVSYLDHKHSQEFNIFDLRDDSRIVAEVVGQGCSTAVIGSRRSDGRYIYGPSLTRCLDDINGMALANGINKVAVSSWKNGSVIDFGCQLSSVACAPTVALEPLDRGTMMINSMNKYGEIVGISGEYHSLRPVLWQNGIPTALSDRPGQATDINDRRHIVGNFATGSNWAEGAPFVRLDGVTLKELEPLLCSTLPHGESLTSAKSINNNREIVGNGKYWDSTSFRTFGYHLYPAVIRP